MTTITTSEWMQAMEAALAARPSGDEGMTTQELADALGMSFGAMSARLQLMFRAGRLVPGRSPRMAKDGSMRNVPVYRLKA